MKKTTGCYKKKVKSLLENNRSLAAVVQNYRCESMLKEKMFAEASITNVEHIFSARLKLNKLAQVLKESYLSIEEILSVLELCSSTFPSQFTQKNTSSTNKLKRSLSDSLNESIDEIQELMLTSDCDISTNVLHANQGDRPVPPSTHKKSAATHHDSELLSKSNLQESNDVCAKPVAVALNVPSAAFSTLKNLKKANKAHTVYNKKNTTKRITKKRQSSESKVTYKLKSPTQVLLPKNPLQNPQNIKTISNEDQAIPVLQENTKLSVSKKKRKLFIQPPKIKEKQCPIKQKLLVSSTKHKVKNTLGNKTENVYNEENGDYAFCHNQAIHEDNNLKTEQKILIEMNCLPSNLPEHLEQDEAQSLNLPNSSNINKESTHNPIDVAEQKDVSTFERSKTENPPKLDECNCLLNNLNKCNNKMPTIISSKNKSKSKSKASFQIDSDKIFVEFPNKKRRRLSNQRNKKNYSKIHTVSEDRKSFHYDCLPSGIPVLQSLENICSLNENLHKNVLVVSAEIHPPPPHCAPIQNQPVLPKHIIKNVQPCVVLTNIFETKSTVKSTNETCTSSEAMNKCQDAELSISQSSRNSSDTESSQASHQPERRFRHRPQVSYKEPALNHKMRQV